MRDISAVLINDEIQGERAYLKKVPTFKNMSSYPYPNPIKLLPKQPDPNYLTRMTGGSIPRWAMCNQNIRTPRLITMKIYVL